MRESKGWFLIDRKFFSHFLWTERREFSKAEAWIDLIALARYSTEPAKKMINGQLVQWDRGQLIASIRFLKKRWKWKSNTKVEGFLKLLKNENMILRENKTSIGRITICNYNFYQEPRDSREDTYKTAKGQAEDKTVKNGENRGKESKYTINSSDSWTQGQPIDYQSFIDTFNQLYNKSLKVTDKKRENIRARLLDFTGAEILKAWEIRLKDDWLNSEKEGKYLGDWSAAMRNSEKIDRYLNQDNGIGLGTPGANLRGT